MKNQFVHFITFDSFPDVSTIGHSDLERLRNFVRGIPFLVKAYLHTSATAQDRYVNDGPSPKLVIELHYNSLTDAEFNIADGGYLKELGLGQEFGFLSDCRINHQVMAGRKYPILESSIDPTLSMQGCSYLVHYPGPAKDINEWLNYYVDHHPEIMKKFPNIRGIEIYSRVDWIDRMGWERVNYMQRNKVVFDYLSDLEGALGSKVRDEMRSDFDKFPPFDGGSKHYAVRTDRISGSG